MVGYSSPFPGRSVRRFLAVEVPAIVVVRCSRMWHQPGTLLLWWLRVLTQMPQSPLMHLHSRHARRVCRHRQRTW